MCTLPRSKLKICSKHWKLHTKFVSTVCKDVVRRTVAAFLALAKAFLNTSEDWLCRASFNNFFKSVFFVVSTSLHSESATRLEVLGEKIWTASWLGPMLEPNIFTNPVKVLMRAIPLMQTFCSSDNKIQYHIQNVQFT